MERVHHDVVENKLPIIKCDDFSSDENKGVMK